MVAATYTSDLTDIFLFESTTGVSAFGGGAGGLGVGADYAIEGTNAVDKQVSASEKGFLYDNGANFTIGANDHFFEWIIVGTPGLADTRDNRGIFMCIGDSTNAFVKFHLNGVDTLPRGGMQPYAVRFVNTTLTNLRTLVGSPGTTPSQIGGGANITATAKFANFACDGARIGTGYDILNGTGADPEATFSGISTNDESTSEGIFQSVGGGYNLQGKIRIGSAGTACEFLDTNTNINILDTIHSLTDFTEILLENASSILTLRNVNFNALGTNNPGRFEMLTSAATALLTNCGFIGFGVTILGTGATFGQCRWIEADTVTANGATLTTCAFTGCPSTSALVTQNLNLVTKCVFTSAGTGYAVDLGNIASTQSLNWDNTDTGYAATDGTTGNETILVDVDSGFTLTINVQPGASTPTVHNVGLGTVNVVVGLKTLTFTVNPAITGYEWRLGVDDPASGKLYTTELDGEESATLSTQTYTTGTANTGVIQIIAAGYVEYTETVSLGVSDVTRTLNLVKENNQ